MEDDTLKLETLAEQNKRQAQAFGEWFGPKVKALGLSYSLVAGKMNVHRNALYPWSKGMTLPDPASCKRIALAMGLDPMEVLAAAGWVEDESGNDRQQLLSLVRYLPEEQLANALSYLRFLLKN